MAFQRVDQLTFRKAAGDFIRRARIGQQIIVVDGEGKTRMVIGTNGRQALFDVAEPDWNAIADRPVSGAEQQLNGVSWFD